MECFSQWLENSSLLILAQKISHLLIFKDIKELKKIHFKKSS